MELASSFILKKNQAKIKVSFVKLVWKVKRRLEAKAIDVIEFRLYTQILFGTSVLTDTSLVSIKGILDAISHNCLWNYLDYHSIEEIAKEFAGDDIELRGWISDYKSELTGFRATIKIVDYINAHNYTESADASMSLWEDKSRYDYSKLSIKLMSRVTEKSLDYIDQLWISFAEEFVLPSLASLLDSITGAQVNTGEKAGF